MHVDDLHALAAHHRLATAALGSRGPRGEQIATHERETGQRAGGRFEELSARGHDGSLLDGAQGIMLDHEAPALAARRRRRFRGGLGDGRCHRQDARIA